MNCPCCSAPYGENDRFCRYCGAPLQSTPQRKGSHWVPILILILLSAIGIGIFFITTEDPPGTTVRRSDTPWFILEDDGTLYFDESLYTGGSELTVPAELGGRTVRSLGVDCFTYCNTLTTVYLPNTLEVIEDYAFNDCKRLRGIFIPESVTSIGEGAFYGCENLEAISIPGSVVSIGTQAFGACNSLDYILYDGLHEDWVTLYDEFITPYTGVYCLDGSFYQGINPAE